MAKELNDMLKKDLIVMVEKLQKKNTTLSCNADKLKLRVAEVEEENKYLAMQQEESDVVDVTIPVTTPKATQKKVGQMNEFELAEHMRKTTSRKIL